MALDQKEQYLKMVLRGKYQRLYQHLSSLQAQEWRTTFNEVEAVIGFDLPSSARLHRPWWGNQRDSSGHSHALAWSVAGWETAEVDMEAETLLFRRADLRPVPRPPLDEAWPVHPTAVWPEGLSLRREDLYEERIEGLRRYPSKPETREENHTVAGHSFVFVGSVRPERDERGEVIGNLPQSGYPNERSLPLNRYGEGPFCEFRVASGWKQSGVYVLMAGGNPLYVGECQNLEDRWGRRGYGHISPRNCYKGGQETNCRINNLIYWETKSGAEFELLFNRVEGNEHTRRDIESELVSALKPPWNR